MASLRIFIHAKWDKYDQKWEYKIRESDYTKYGEALLEVRNVEFTTPDDLAMKALVVKALRFQKSEILAAAAVEAMNVQEDIDELLALEDKTKRATRDPEEIPF